MDLLLGKSSHDLVFQNGTCPVTRDLAESTEQRIKIKLLTFLGEWFLDTTYGIPYFTEIFGKGRLKTTIDGIFQQAILEEPGVLELLDFQSTIQDREYSMSFKVRVADGITNTITISTVGV